MTRDRPALKAQGAEAAAGGERAGDRRGRPGRGGSGGCGLKGPRPALGRAPAPKRAVGGVPGCPAHPGALFTAPAASQPLPSARVSGCGWAGRGTGLLAGGRLVRGEAEAPRQAEAAAAPSPPCCRESGRRGNRPLGGGGPRFRRGPWCCRGFGTAVRCGVTLKSPPAP